MATDIIPKWTGGAIGAGLVLVVLPSAALFFGIGYLSERAAVGLPLLAIFGIMILFGAMALTSTLFARLGLSNRNEALALPAGSVRAAIALALVVLFAIIAIMLFQSLSQPYRIDGLSLDEKSAIVKEPGNRVLAVKNGMPCPPASAASAVAPAADAAASCFEVHLVQSPGQEAVDIAKQLLILVGTLMTSVTSYYFAARTAEPTRQAGPAGSTGAAGVSPPAPPGPADAAAPAATPAAAAAAAAAATPHMHAATGESDAVDGCDVEITGVTPDDQLPASKGGVA